MWHGAVPQVKGVMTWRYNVAVDRGQAQYQRIGSEVSMGLFGGVGSSMAQGRLHEDGMSTSWGH